jgi:hypothetical protein
MNNPKTRIFAQNGAVGLEIYLDISGIKHFLTTRRHSGLLYLWLKDGKTLGELHRIRPNNTGMGQKTYHHAQHLVKLAEEYLENGLRIRQWC